jgi:hypothetical protein
MASFLYCSLYIVVIALCWMSEYNRKSNKERTDTKNEANKIKSEKLRESLILLPQYCRKNNLIAP